MSCTNNNLYASLEFCPGSPKLSGIRQKVYYIPKRDISAWPTLPAIDGTNTMSTLGAYTGNFTLATDKVWLFMDTIEARDNVSTEAQGDVPSRTNNVQAEIVMYETEEAAVGFARMANNDDFVYLVQQRNGKFRVVGNQSYRTDTQVGIALGEGVDGEVGTTLTIAVTDIAPAPFYPGNIVTEDGTISGADGSVVE